MKRLKTSIITSDSIHELNNIKGPIIESMIAIDVIAKIYNKYKVLHHVGDKTNIVNEDYFKSINVEDVTIDVPVVDGMVDYVFTSEEEVIEDVAVVEETPVSEKVVEDTVVVEETPVNEETVKEVIEDVAVVEETPVSEKVVEDTVVVEEPNKYPKNDKKPFDKNKNKK